MGATGEVRLERVEPILQVHDLEEALSFYADGLGFERAWTWGDPPERAGVQRDGAWIHLAFKAPFAPDAASFLYVHMVGVDAYYAELVEKGVQMIAPIWDAPWGAREFRLADPSGNHVAFGEPT